MTFLRLHSGQRLGLWTDKWLLTLFLLLAIVLLILNGSFFYAHGSSFLGPLFFPLSIFPVHSFFAFATLKTIKDRKSQITIPAVRGLFAVAPSSMSEGSVEIAGLTNYVFFPSAFFTHCQFSSFKAIVRLSFIRMIKGFLRVRGNH